MKKYKITMTSGNKEVIQADEIHTSKDGFARFKLQGEEVAIFKANSIESVVKESVLENRSIGFTRKSVE